MPNIGERPYIGTWRLNNKRVVKHTPDCLVFFNGDVALPGCQGCSGRIDVQRYIQSVNVDAGIEPGSHSCSISMSVPRVQGESMFKDGRAVLRPGLELHIYMRGYFPVRSMYDNIADDVALPDGLSLKGLPNYPYYHVFHGVVTGVNHEYSDGQYQVSISGASMLHFWQFQNISTSGSYFGARPENSGVKMSLIGHNFTGMSPYAIMYTLHKNTVGAAAGVGFALGSKTNQTAASQIFNKSLYSLLILYWERRFRQRMYNLRMYGANGKLFNGLQQAFLAKTSNRDLRKIIKATQYRDVSTLWNESDPWSDKFTVAKALGLEGAGLDVIYAQRSSDRGAGLEVSLIDMQAFVTDISAFGEVNLWESQYQTKLDIANSVREVTGFEFYQDMDGDLVFKPPFYNLDTSASRVYRLEDIDIINFTQADKEPEATYITVKGSQFKNITGLGLDNEMGLRSQYIDYRLVAQYGWRPAALEISYYNDARSMFYAGVAQMDILNADVHGASSAIPLRPEMRPGYPVYVPGLDCYYYLNALNHSYTVGSQCTTTLTLTARRAKFYAPGDPDKRGVGAIKLDRLTLPEKPLEVVDNNGMPRLSGFPNVVMGLDNRQLNPRFWMFGFTIEDLKNEANIEHFFNTVIQKALSSSKAIVGEEAEDTPDFDIVVAPPEKYGKDPDKDKFTFQVDQDKVIRVSLSELKREARKVLEARQAVIEAQKVLVDKIQDVQGSSKTKRQRDQIISKAEKSFTKARESFEALVAQSNDAGLFRLVNAAFNLDGDQQTRALEGIDESAETAAYLQALSDVKANFVSSSLPGFYRYFSASHPEPKMQGTTELLISEGSNVEGGQKRVYRQGQNLQLSQVEEVDGYAVTPRRLPGQVVEPEAQFTRVKVDTGLRIARPRGLPPQITPTHLIQTLSFAAYPYSKKSRMSGRKPRRRRKYDGRTFSRKFSKLMRTAGKVNFSDPSQDVGTLFSGTYSEAVIRVETALSDAETDPATQGIIAPLIAGAAGDVGALVAELPTLLEASPTVVDPRDDSINLIVNLPSDVARKTKARTIEGRRYRGYAGSQSTMVSKVAKTLTDAFTNGINTVNAEGKVEPLRTGLLGIYRDLREEADKIEDQGQRARTQTELVRLFNRIAKDIAEYDTALRESNNARTKKKFRRRGTVYAPVFPVSDANGYEVYGAYRYGRGLTVEPGGTMEFLHNIDTTAASAEDPFRALNAAEVAAFLAALESSLKQLQTAEGIKSLNQEPDFIMAKAAGTSTFERTQIQTQVLARQAAEMALNQLANQPEEKIGKDGFDGRKIAQILVESNGDIFRVGEDGDIVLGSNPADPDGNQFVQRFANSAATMKLDGAFKTSVSNAAYHLRELGSHLSGNRNRLCTCRAAEADILLEAFGRTDFIGITSPEETDKAGAFVSDLMVRESVDWRFHQDALRGTGLDRGRPSLIDAIGDLPRSTVNTAQTGRQGIQQANEQLLDIARGLSEVGEE